MRIVNLPTSLLTAETVISFMNHPTMNFVSMVAGSKNLIIASIVHIYTSVNTAMKSVIVITAILFFGAKTVITAARAITSQTVFPVINVSDVSTSSINRIIFLTEK